MPTTEESILLSIKKLIGGIDDETDTAFNIDLIIFINSNFTILSQLGVGPSKPFKITGTSETWSDFNYGDIESVKEYMFLKTKLIFNPPENSSVKEEYSKKVSELEWRMNVMAEEGANGSD